MTGYFDKPMHWRMRADMTRTIAEGMPDAGRRILLDIAQSYEQMATALEADQAQQHGVASERLTELQKRWGGDRSR